MTVASATATPASVPIRIAMAVLMPANEDFNEEEAKTLPTKTPNQADIVRFLDPVAPQLLTAWVEVRFDQEGREIRLDLPHKEPDDMYELLETLYVLHGWKGVDAVYDRVQRSLVAAVMETLRLFPQDEANAIALLVPSSKPLYIPPDHVDLSATAIGNLIAMAEAAKRWPRVIEGLKAVVPVNGLFSSNTPHAEAEISGNSEFAARLFADVLVSLQNSRRKLAARVMGVLRRTEREANRLISATLTDSRATIVRETIRYFSFRENGAEPALIAGVTKPALIKGTTTSYYAAADEQSNSELAAHPKALKVAMKQIVPFALEVLALEKSKKAPLPLTSAPPSTVKHIDTLLQPKRAALAREVGRHAQAFPILSQIDLEDIEKVSNAGRQELGAILFPLLTRAYAANKEISSRVKRFGAVVEGLAGARHPEQALAAAVREIGHGKSVWSFPKYIEKATERVTGEGDDVANMALASITTMLEIQSEKMLEAISQAAGEMLVLGTATHFAVKFVPVLNVATAAWHISTAVQDFDDQHDEFYCALDPRDALVETSPSVAGLALDIALEAAFAFI